MFPNFDSVPATRNSFPMLENNFLTTSSWELILLKYEILVILGGNEEELIASKELMFAAGLAAPGWKCIPEHEH